MTREERHGGVRTTIAELQEREDEHHVTFGEVQLVGPEPTAA